MEKRSLGSSGLDVSELAFGALTIGGKGTPHSVLGGLERGDADRLVSLCIERGITLFDTADIYSDGASERMLGQALGPRRADVLISTKGGLRTGTEPHDVGSSRRHLLKACDDSLRRLNTDWIDLYQLHAFDSLTPLEETFGALDELVTSGKVRHVGCSNFAAWQLAKALAAADRETAPRLASHQVYYSLVGRDVEHEIVPVSLDQDVGIIVWGALASGLLSGRLRRDEEPPADTRLGAIPEARLMFDWQRGHDALDICRRIADERSVPVGQVAFNWVLRKPGVTSVLIGARNETQLLDNLGAADWTLTEHEVRELDAAYAPTLPYPIWHQRSPYGAERNPPLPTYQS